MLATLACVTKHDDAEVCLCNCDTATSGTRSTLAARPLARWRLQLAYSYKCVQDSPQWHRLVSNLRWHCTWLSDVGACYQRAGDFKLQPQLQCELTVLAELELELCATSATPEGIDTLN